MTVRKPAVAGFFYPGETKVLRRDVEFMLDEARRTAMPGRHKVLVAPHAGYRYSGTTAAAGYAALDVTGVERVVIYSPTHCVGIHGIASPHVKAFETPLGRVRVDVDTLRHLESLPMVHKRPDVHADEHAIEVQLPFIQQILPKASIVPLAVSECDPDDVADAMDLAWGGDETLIVISSDLSHYLSYDKANAVDADTLERIVSFERLAPNSACGMRALNGMMVAGKRRGLRAQVLTHCNSGDTAGDKARVVGYAAIVMDDHA